MRFFGRHFLHVSSILDVEKSALETFIYKNHHRFRNDKGFKDTKLVSKCLSRFYEVGVDKVTRDFLDAFPVLSDLMQQRPVAVASSLYLPTANMLTYVRERLAGAFRLLEKLCVYCKMAGKMQINRINLGHFWNVALSNLAVISRIW